MKLSSFNVGEYAIDSDGEVVKIIKKSGRGANMGISFEVIVCGGINPNKKIGSVQDEGIYYGAGRESDEWKRWTPPAKVNGDPKILKRIEEARKSLEELENAYKASLKPKVEFIPGMAYDISDCPNPGCATIGIFIEIDIDGDHVFIFDTHDDVRHFMSAENAQKAKPLTKPNQKKAAKIIYDFHKEGKFPEN